MNRCQEEASESLTAVMLSGGLQQMVGVLNTVAFPPVHSAMTFQRHSNRVVIGDSTGLRTRTILVSRFNKSNVLLLSQRSRDVFERMIPSTSLQLVQLLWRRIQVQVQPPVRRVRRVRQARRFCQVVEGQRRRARVAVQEQAQSQNGGNVEELGTRA
jgi:hypothetical protein